MDVMTGMRVAAAAPPCGEDALLLREFCHRTGNDYAVALGALRVATSGRLSDPAERSRLIAQVEARLQATVELHRLLARPVPLRVEAGAWIRTVCEAIACAHGPDGGMRVEFDLSPIWLDGATVRRLALVAAELVANAFKYAAGERGGRLVVDLRDAVGGVTLRVCDDGPGIVPGAAPSGGGLGSGIVAELVRMGGGRLSVRSGPTGTAVQVDMPATTERDLV